MKEKYNKFNEYKQGFIDAYLDVWFKNYMTDCDNTVINEILNFQFREILSKEDILKFFNSPY